MVRVFSFFFVLTLISGCDNSTQTEITPNRVPVPVDAPPLIEGPQPKASFSPPMYEFGTIPLGVKRTFDFKITNKGEGELTLKVGPKDCKCTEVVLPKEKLAPGESVVVKASWKVEGSMQDFEQVARILTNDADNVQLELKVKGRVVPLFLMSPPDLLVSDFKTDKPTELTAFMGSHTVEKFAISDIKSTSPLLSATFRVATKEEAPKEFEISWYALDIKISPDVPIGVFNEKLLITTDAKDTPHEVAVTGFRPGPISIVGPRWDAKAMHLNMADFKANKGGKATLHLLVPKGQQFELTEVECDEPLMKVELRKEESGTSTKHHLDFTVGESKIPFRRAGKGSVKVKLHTNHPEMKVISLTVQFNAL